jgi:SnoaL-like polyketide cyclase
VPRLPGGRARDHLAGEADLLGISHPLLDAAEGVAVEEVGSVHGMPGPAHGGFARGDVAVAETTWRGVHVGPFLDVPATKRRIEIPVILVISARDGLMAGERLYWDRATLADQLNVDIKRFRFNQSPG